MNYLLESSFKVAASEISKYSYQDEEQLKHADSRLKEELGDVIINEQLETVEEELQWSDIPWMDPRWLDPRPAMFNAGLHSR